MAFNKYTAKSIFKIGSLLVGQGPVRSLVASSYASGTLTLDMSKADTYKITLGANVTAMSITNPTTGQELKLQLLQDATGSRTVTWASNVKLSGGAVTLTTTAAKTDSFHFVYDGTNWRELSRSLNS
jgi:hypothetical protein